MKTLSGAEEYKRLEEYAALRTRELAKMLKPYIEVTDSYGEIICAVVSNLGAVRPQSPRESAQRDLTADVFDFLYEARPLIIKGKLEIAYPLARRAYETLSLLVAFKCEPKLCDRWMEGRKISNRDVRAVLDKHPYGEPAERTRALYNFFSETTHSNRAHIPHRFLGEGNTFVLGSVGRPSLVLLADYALKTLDLWFWFGAVTMHDVIARPDIRDETLFDAYDRASKMAKPISSWLVDQFNKVLKEEQEMIARQREAFKRGPA